MSARAGMCWPALSAALMIGAAACGGDGAAPPEKTTPVAVRVATVVSRPVPRSFEAGGILKARTTAQIAPRIAAELRDVRVRPGDRVRQGETVALLDDRDLAAQRLQAHAALLAAQSDAASAGAERESANARLVLARDHYRRIELLRRKDSATPQEFDRAAADMRIAEAGARAAEARADAAAASASAARAAGRAADVTASFSTISAPFDGLITNRLLEPGNMTSPGVPLLTIETTDEFRFEAPIDAARARFIEVGDPVAVDIDGGQAADPLTGRVVEVARAIDPMSHAFVVKVEIPSAPAARSGVFARGRFTAGSRQALAVPASAMVRRGQLSFVFIVDHSSRARMRVVTDGEHGGDWIEVLAGVREGETVILDPPALLVDGVAVERRVAQP